MSEDALALLLKDLSKSDKRQVRVIAEFLGCDVATGIAERVVNGSLLQDCLSAEDRAQLEIHAQAASSYGEHDTYMALRRITGYLAGVQKH